MSWNFPYRGETEILERTNRSSAPGDFLALEDGITHYQLGGPKSGSPIVLVHGFSVPFFIWDPTFDFLIRQGFRVLRYDLFGRGYSDRPALHYDIHCFTKQLKDLLEKLGIEKQVHLFGLSMGGPIVASFTVHFPERICKLVLIDPAGTKSTSLSALLNVATLPGLGELLFGLFGSESLVKGIASDFFGADLVETFQARYKVQMKYKGFKRAILRTIRNGMLGEFSTAYHKVGKLPIPALLLWGEQDRTVPFAYHSILRELMPEIEFHSIPNCGHVPHYEKPEVVNPILLSFLNRAASKPVP